MREFTEQRCCNAVYLSSFFFFFCLLLLYDGAGKRESGLTFYTEERKRHRLHYILLHSFFSHLLNLVPLASFVEGGSSSLSDPKFEEPPPLASRALPLALEAVPRLLALMLPISSSSLRCSLCRWQK